MASVVPKWVKKEIVDSYVAEDLWLMLMKNTFAPNAAHRYVADVLPATHEITDIGLVYPAGGVPVPVKSADASGNNYFLNLGDIDIGPGAYLNYRYGILYTKTGGSGQATYKIRVEIDFDPVTELDQIVTNGTATIEISAAGVLLLSS